MGQLPLKEHFDSLIGANPQKTIAVLDEQGTIQMAHWQVPLTIAGEVLGTNLLDHVPMEQRQAVCKAMLDLANIDDATELLLPLLDGDGHVTWWSSRFLLFTRQGKNRVFVLEGEETSGPGELEEEVSDPQKVLDLLLTAMMDREVLELELDGEPETFASLMLEYSPPEWHPCSIEDENCFKPGGYLLKHESLFICPLEPAYGNIRLRRCKRIVLRFHQNLVAMEADVTLQRVWASQGQHLIELNFPALLRCQQIRSARRVKVPPGTTVKTVIQPQGGRAFDVRLMDISPYGLSFQYPPGADTLANNTEITLTLHTGEVGAVKLEGQVCNHRETRDEADTNRRHLMCGVEFFAPTDDAEGERLRKLVLRLFKKNQKVMAMKRGKFGVFFAEKQNTLS